jgi:hypothetical protein
MPPFLSYYIVVCVSNTPTEYTLLKEGYALSASEFARGVKGDFFKIGKEILVFINNK